MKSRTSFFDKTVLKKDITRFAPLWCLYLIGGLLLSITITSLNGRGYSVAGLLSNVIGPFGVISLVYAVLNAQLLFGDLFNARLCNALHALPLRREGWFLTHVTAGFLFSLVPNTAISVSMMPNLGQFWYTSLLWLLGMELHYLFFFGLAVFCMMLTGNRFAATAVYGIINFFSMIAMWFATVVFEPMLYGVVIRPDIFKPFSPVVHLCSQEEFFLMAHDPNCICQLGYPRPEEGFQHSYQFNGLTGSWQYLTVLAVLGLVLGIAALVLYRKRHLEYAGDFMAFKGVKPVFTLVYTLCVGACLQLIGNLFGDSLYIFMAIGLLVGYFTSQMLLSRSLKVFKPGNWLYAALILVLVFGSLGLCKLDVFGIVSWTPDADDVEEVLVADSQIDKFTDRNTDAEIYDRESIEKLIAIHEMLYQEGPTDWRDTPNGWQNVTICYKLKDGRQVYRQYRATRGGAAEKAINDLIFSNPLYLLKAVSFDDLLGKVVAVYADGLGYGDSARESLLAAVWADAQAGTLRANGYKDDYTYICDIHLVYQSGYDLYLNIFSNSTNITQWVKDTMLHSLSPEALMDNTSFVVIHSIELDWNDRERLEQFCELVAESWGSGTLIEGAGTDGYTVELHFNNGSSMTFTVTEKAEKFYQWIEDFLLTKG